MKLTPIALLLSAQAACVAPGHAQSDIVVPPLEAVAGSTQVEWSRAWWQWAASFDRQDSPVADQTGALCARKQQGRVWFLAGTYGTQRTVRTCKIPRDTYLFFPLINYVVMPRADRPISCLVAMSEAARMTDDVTALILDVNGTRIPNLTTHRLATRECFDIGLRTDPKVRVYPSAANGYYVMLRPLSPGTQTLNFGGALPSMLQAVTYTLQVD